MSWKPQTAKDVWPGQDWRFPDGKTWHVGALVSGDGERTVLCTCKDGAVLHLPAETLFTQAEFIGSK